MSDFDLTADDARVLVIDVQERFLGPIPAIAAEAPVGRACAALIEGAGHLAVPVTFSEQYPQGLGPTLPALRALSPAAPVYAKTAFSCADDGPLREALAADGRGWLLCCGIEAHICVLATVDDCLRRGWQVAVAADAVASRDPSHTALAHEAMRQLGALVLPVESLLFRLQRRATGPAFKALSALTRRLAAGTPCAS